VSVKFLLMFEYCCEFAYYYNDFVSLDVLIYFKCLKCKVQQEAVKSLVVRCLETQQEAEAFLVLSSLTAAWDGMQT